MDCLGEKKWILFGFCHRHFPNILHGWMREWGGKDGGRKRESFVTRSDIALVCLRLTM